MTEGGGQPRTGRVAPVLEEEREEKTHLQPGEYEHLSAS